MPPQHVLRMYRQYAPSSIARWSTTGAGQVSRTRRAGRFVGMVAGWLTAEQTHFALKMHSAAGRYATIKRKELKMQGPHPRHPLCLPAPLDLNRGVLRGELG